MLILGIDPGTATTGYGIIHINGGNELEVIEFGLIETSKESDPSVRLLSIHQQIVYILDKHNPDVVAIEQLFFATNAKTAMRVGQALGVLLFAAAQSHKSIFEYAPGTIKKMVAGSGRADKIMMQESVRKVLGPKVRSKVHKKTHFDNAADALAVALCHIYHTHKGFPTK